MQYTFVSLSIRLTAAQNTKPILRLAVYPETKGVPLEEMDVVFGEGLSGKKNI